MFNLDICLYYQKYFTFPRLDVGYMPPKMLMFNLENYICFQKSFTFPRLDVGQHDTFTDFSSHFHLSVPMPQHWHPWLRKIIRCSAQWILCYEITGNPQSWHIGYQV